MGGADHDLRQVAVGHFIHGEVGVLPGGVASSQEGERVGDRQRFPRLDEGLGRAGFALHRNNLSRWPSAAYLLSWHGF